MATGGITPVGAGNVAAAPKTPPAPAPAANPAPAAAPAATATLSPEAAQGRVNFAYESWNTAIGNGVNNSDPDARNAARGVLGASLQQTQQQAEEAKAAGRPYDMDVGLAANMANNTATTLLGGEKSPDPNAQSTKTLAEMNATALNYLEARKAQAQADITANGGGQPPAGQ